MAHGQSSSSCAPPHVPVIAGPLPDHGHCRQLDRPGFGSHHRASRCAIGPGYPRRMWKALGVVAIIGCGGTGTGGPGGGASPTT